MRGFKHGSRSDLNSTYNKTNSSSIEVSLISENIPVYFNGENDLQILVVVISIFGIVGNVLTLSKIVLDKEYHCTVFYVIGTIIFTDLVNLCLYFIHARIQIADFKLGELPCQVFLIVFYGATHSSASHVVLLFGLRSYMVSEPIKFNKITIRNIFCASAVLWILSACFAVMYFLLRYESGIQSSTYVIVTFRVYLIIIPTLLIMAFHLRKMHRLKRRSMSRHNVETNLIKMSLVTTVVLFAYMSSAVLFLLCYILSLYSLRYLERNFMVAAQFAWLINCILSPFVYFIAALRACNCFKYIKTTIQDKL
ncbi:G-protein coupled receptor 183-like [Crassostrea angulata]|uniref:G-protein coupled receptor 183-like n=1 Tax=Magallana angulata TaxID=2784310 RepID=UPI0022B0FDA8|nr:G-protein coupled receptor 183-like [Crassostrea angulata]